MNISIFDEKLFLLGDVKYPRIYQAIPTEDKIRLQNIFERTQQLGDLIAWEVLVVDGTTPTNQGEAISMLNAVVYA